MKTQKTVNLLGDANNESSNFARRRWYVISHQNNTEYGEGDENGSSIKFEKKLLNQIFVIIQMHIFL